MNSFYMLGSGEKYTSFVAVDEGVILSSYMYTPLPPLEKYRALRVTPYREGHKYGGSKTIDNGDFPDSQPMIISQRAVDAMGNLLANSGTLYPLEVHNAQGFHGDYWMFHVTNIIDCLDEERCTGARGSSSSGKSAWGGKFATLYTFFLDKTKIPAGADIFRVPGYPLKIFVSDNFHQEIKKHRLTGVELLPEGAQFLDPKAWIVLNKSLARKKT